MAPRRGEYVKDTEEELVVGAGGGVVPMDQEGILGWQPFKACAEAKATVFPVFGSKIVSCLRHMGLFGADLVLVLKTEIHLWIQVLQSDRTAAIKIVKQISRFLQCQCSPGPAFI